MEQFRLTIEEINDDPATTARFRAAHEQAIRNSRWLESHGAELLPRALGKFIAVAGQEAFIADSSEQAWAWARSVHPDDHGAFVEYVIPTPGPRLYSDRGVRILAHWEPRPLEFDFPSEDLPPAKP